MVPYNFFVSQRPAVILSENGIQIPADKMIWTEFRITLISISKIELPITLISISKIELKDRKRTDCRGRIRGAIAPVDDITLRCNHSTNHVNDTWWRRKALKPCQRTNFVILDA